MNLSKSPIRHLPISAIKVKKRIREDMGDIESLAESIRTQGLLQPIVVDNQYRLIAGGRRLSAAKRLNWKKIEARMIEEDLSDLQRIELEINENQLRQDFSESEYNKALKTKFGLQIKEDRSIFGYWWYLLKQLFKDLFLNKKD